MQLLSGSLSDDERSRWDEALKVPDSPESRIVQSARTLSESRDVVGDELIWRGRLDQYGKNPPHRG